MARRRKPKRRKTSNSSAEPQTQTTMSISDVASLGPESSDSNSTDPRDSEGVRTEMTSINEDDPELLGAVLEVDDPEDMVEDHDEDDDLSDDSSFYAQSQYPRVMASHRTEYPYLTARMEARMERDAQTIASTRSLYAQDLDYVEEHGRRYCGVYHMPNDDKEQDRLRLIHQVYLHIFDCRLTSVPLVDPEEILDIGTGTGDWAIGMGELYPDCRVTGTDISAIQDTSVPENVYFEIDDAEEEWERGADTFDLIHLRNLLGAFRDWTFIYDQAFLHLKPGGWLEVMDFDDKDGFKKFLSVFPPESDLHVLARDLHIAAMKSGRPRGVAHLDPLLFTEAGFVDIKTTEHIIPINLHNDPRGKAGKIWLAACLTGLEAACLRPLTKHMGWDGEKLKRVCENVANEMKTFAFDREKSQGLIIKVRILTGRKPFVAADWTTAASGSVTGHDDDTMDEDNDGTGDDTDVTPGTGTGVYIDDDGYTRKTTPLHGNGHSKGGTAPRLGKMPAPFDSQASFALSELSSTMDVEERALEKIAEVGADAAAAASSEPAASQAQPQTQGSDPVAGSGSGSGSGSGTK